MIPNKDQYADKDGNLTDDPAKFAMQIAVAGVFLDERIAKRYGIEDSLVSVDEPNAPRRVMQRNEVSTKIVRAEEKKEEKPQEPQEPAAAEEPKAEKPKAEAKKPAAKKGEQKK